MRNRLCFFTQIHLSIRPYVTNPAMKFALLLLIMLPHAFGAITSAERQDALSSASLVMAEVSGKSDAKLINAHISDEIGTRVLVQFAYVSDLETGSQKCSYSYDRVLGKVVRGSWGCER